MAHFVEIPRITWWTTTLIAINVLRHNPSLIGRVSFLHLVYHIKHISSNPLYLLWLPLQCNVSLFTANPCFMKHTNYKGINLNTCFGVTQSPEECQRLCQSKSGCSKFTWVSPDYIPTSDRHGECCLKGGRNPNYIAQHGIVAGPKFCLGRCSILLGYYNRKILIRKPRNG